MISQANCWNTWIRIIPLRPSKLLIEFIKERVYQRNVWYTLFLTVLTGDFIEDILYLQSNIYCVGLVSIYSSVGSVALRFAANYSLGVTKAVYICKIAATLKQRIHSVRLLNIKPEDTIIRSPANTLKRWSRRRRKSKSLTGRVR